MDLSVQTRNRSYKPIRGQYFYKISNLKLSDNPLKTLKKEEKTDGEAAEKLRLNCRWSLNPSQRLECSEC